MLRLTRLAEPADQADDEGFLLIEVVVAMVVFALLAAAVAVTLTQAANSNRSNRLRTAATGIAAKSLAQTRAQALDANNHVDPTKLVDGSSTTTTMQDDVTYTVTENIETTTDDSTAGTCGAAAGLPAYKLVSESVSWVRMGGVAPVRTESLIALPSGSIDSSLSAIAVSVLSSTGTPVAGAAVSLTGPSTNLSLTSDGNGCATFINVPIGTGFVASSTLPGYVNALSSATGTSSSGTTVSGATTKLSIQPFEQSATITAAIGSVTAGYTYPTDLPFSSKSTAATIVTTGTGFPRTTAGVYASGGAWSSWLGSCADSTPGSPPATSLTPGGTGNVTLAGPVPFTVLPVNGSNVAVTSGTLDIVHLPTTGCTAGEAHISIPITGSALKIAMPLGTWTFKVNDTSTATAPFGTAQQLLVSTAMSSTTVNKVRVTT